jgi:hypothetical protein
MIRTFVVGVVAGAALAGAASGALGGARPAGLAGGTPASSSGHAAPATLNTAPAVAATPGPCRGGLGCTGVPASCVTAVGWCPPGGVRGGSGLPTPEAVPQWAVIPHSTPKPKP